MSGLDHVEGTSAKFILKKMLAPAIAIMVIAIIIKMIIKKITMLMTKMRVITTITRFAQFDRLKHGKSSECLKLSQQIVLFFDAGNSCAAGFKTHDSKFPKKKRHLTRSVETWLYAKTGPSGLVRSLRAKLAITGHVNLWSRPVATPPGVGRLSQFCI